MSKQTVTFVVLPLALLAALAGFLALLYIQTRQRPEPAAPPPRLNLKDARILVRNWPGMNDAERRDKLPLLAQAFLLDDARLRLRAALVLAEMGPEGLQPLREAARDDEDADLRFHALLALGLMGPDAAAALPEIQRGLSDPDPDVRRKAMYALVRVRGYHADHVPNLMKAIRDPDADVRQEASEHLVQSGTPAVAPLIDALKDGDAEVRRHAASALGRIGAATPEVLAGLRSLLMASDSQLYEDAAFALTRLGKPAIPVLAEALQAPTRVIGPDARETSSDSDRSQAAATALERMGPDAIPVLVQALQHQDPHVRAQAVSVLGPNGVRDPAAALGLVMALKDPDERVRAKAAWAVPSIGPDPDTVLPVLVPLLNDDSPDFRQKLVAFLVRFEAAAVPHLAKALADADVGVRLAAVQALQDVRSAESVPPLAGALADKEAAVRRAALRALQTLRIWQYVPREAKVASPAMAGVLEPLLRALKDQDAEVRTEAAQLLLVVPVEEQKLLDALQPLLNDDNSGQRRAAVAVLQRCGSAAVPHLGRAARDREVDVRMQALFALFHVAAEPAAVLPVLVQAQKDDKPEVRGYAARALIKFGAAGLPHLIEALKDSNASVRKEVVTALNQVPVDVKLMQPALAQALKDDDEAVRLAAVAAIPRLGNEGIPLLIQALADQTVWKQATKALRTADFDVRMLLPALAQALKHEDSAVRQGAAYAVDRCGIEAVPILIDALADPDIQVQNNAVESLKVIGPPARKAIPPLADLAGKTANVTLRNAAVDALLHVHRLGALSTDHARAVPALVQALRDSDADARRDAALILGLLGPTAREAAPVLTDMATKDPDEKVRQSAKEALTRTREKR